MKERVWTLDELAEALQSVDPHDRDTWVRMGMALKGEFGDAAFEIWDCWSATASNYKAGDAKATWRSFKGSGKVGVGSLIHEAKQGGWSPPERELPPEEVARRQADLRRRQAERRKRAQAEAEEVARWHERVAQLAQEVWDQHLGKVGKAPYLGQKKVRAWGLKFARRGAVLVLDEQAESWRIITGREQINAFFRSEKDAEHLSFRYVKPGTIAVPMRDAAGKLWGLQLIFEGGGKKFLKHGRKSGTFHTIGEPEPEGVLAVAEGYATAASVHEATGWPAVVCWDAGNLAAVAGEMRKLFPSATIVICGDDDHEATDAQGNPANAGRKYGARAAAASRGISAFPRFEDPAGKKDWNDLHVAEGLEVVREQLLAALAQPTAEASPEAEPGPGVEVPPVEAYQGEGSAYTPGSGCAGGGDDGDWEALLVRNRSTNQLKATLHNVITILEHHEAWAGLFALDAFANQIQRVRAAPYGPEPGPLTDVDGTEVAAWFGDPRTYGLSVSSGMALEAVEAVATRRRFHPVLNYLDRLEWDGVERLPHLFHAYFGAEDNEYTRAVGINWMISAVARVRRPGCKVDTMVILEGDQGRGKSTAVRTLCGADWFAEMLESPQNKDFYQVLAGRWIIEIPELQAFNKADRNKIKAAVSAQEDTYRPSYGRYARQFPRQNIFVGTTNDDAYLKDETGARRFLPVRCGVIELEVLEHDRAQLWAEADHRFQKGESWWVFPESAVQEQDARYDADAWEDPIRRWLDGLCNTEQYPTHYPLVDVDRPVAETIIADVMCGALGIETGKHSRPDQMRVGAILRRLGYRRKQKTHQGRVRYVYVRPGAGKAGP